MHMRACAQALICHKLDLSSSISYQTRILGFFFNHRQIFSTHIFFYTQPQLGPALLTVTGPIFKVTI